MDVPWTTSAGWLLLLIGSHRQELNLESFSGWLLFEIQVVIVCFSLSTRSASLTIARGSEL